MKRSLFSYRSFPFLKSNVPPYSCNSLRNRNSSSIVKEESLKSVKMLNLFKERGLGEIELSNIPKSFLKTASDIKNILVADPKVAKRIAFTVCSRLSSDTLLEFDAGIGLMSEVFLQVVPKVRLYLTNQDLIQFLKDKFHNESNDRIKLYELSFTNMLAILYSGPEEQETFDYLMDGLTQKPWTEDFGFSLLVPINNLKYLKSILINLLYETSFKQFGRPEFFLLLPCELAQPIVFEETCDYRLIFVHFLIHIFFDVQVLLNDIPREAILPWPSTKVKKGKNRNQISNNMYLLYVIPRMDRFEPCISRDLIDVIITFIRNMRTHRRIIPLFESFVPYCGSQFILEENLTIYTEFLEISPDKFYRLIQKLTQYPEFDSKMIQNLETQGDIDVDK